MKILFFILFVLPVFPQDKLLMLFSGGISYNGTELITGSLNTGMEIGASIFPNSTFETFTGTPDDGNNDSWTDLVAGATSGKTDATATSVSGYAVKLLNQGGTYSQIFIRTGDVSISPSCKYRWTYFTRGDGTNSSAHRLYDKTNSVNLIANAENNSGVSGTDYTAVQLNFNTAVNGELILAYHYADGTNPSSVYIDNSSIVRMPDWTTTGNHSFDSSSTYKSGGSYSGKIVASGAGNGTTNTISLASTKFTAVTSGTNYRFQVYAYTTTANTTLTFKLGDIVLTNIVSTTGMSVLNFDFKATASTTGNILLYLDKAATVYIDEVSLKSGQ